MSETTLSRRLSTTPIRPEYAYTCLQQTRIDTYPLPLSTVFSLSLLIYSTPDYAHVSMTATEPIFLYTSGHLYENLPVGEAEPVAHSFEFPRLEAERDWLAKPTFLSYLSHTEHLFCINWQSIQVIHDLGFFRLICVLFLKCSRPYIISNK